MSKCKETIRLIKEALIIKYKDGTYARTPTNVGEAVGVTRQAVHHSRNAGTDIHDNKAALLDARAIMLIDEDGKG